MPARYGTGSESDVAYVCNDCGEAFAPMSESDWVTLRAVHRTECLGARFTRTTIRKAF
jgi:hypothetical protein